jgi:hypothetical protein
LETLLDLYVPAGKPCSLPPHVLAALEQALRQPAGFASYAALRNGSSRLTIWRSTITRATPSSAPGSTRSSRCRGPVTPKTPEALPAFQETCLAQVQRVIPPEKTRPVRVFSQDESRFGGLTVRRRRLTACGVQPVGTVPHVFAWFDGYGAVAPTTGEWFCLELPYLNTESFQPFVDTFAQAFPASLTLLRLDHSGIHKAQRLMLPANGATRLLPALRPGADPD